MASGCRCSLYDGQSGAANKRSWSASKSLRRSSEVSRAAIIRMKRSNRWWVWMMWTASAGTAGCSGESAERDAEAMLNNVCDGIFKWWYYFSFSGSQNALLPLYSAVRCLKLAADGEEWLKLNRIMRLKYNFDWNEEVKMGSGKHQLLVRLPS